MKFVRLAIYALLFILGIVLLAVTIVPLAPVENYAVDTLAQLRLCWLVAAAALLSIALFLRRRITAVISVVALVVNGDMRVALFTATTSDSEQHDQSGGSKHLGRASRALR
jgi:polyferredoxin